MSSLLNLAKQISPHEKDPRILLHDAFHLIPTIEFHDSLSNIRPLDASPLEEKIVDTYIFILNEKRRSYSYALTGGIIRSLHPLSLSDTPKPVKQSDLKKYLAEIELMDDPVALSKHEIKEGDVTAELARQIKFQEYISRKQFGATMTPLQASHYSLIINDAFLLRQHVNKTLIEAGFPKFNQLDAAHMLALPSELFITNNPERTDPRLIVSNYICLLSEKTDRRVS